MRLFLAGLHEVCGGVLGCVTGHLGLAEERIDAMRERLLAG